MGAYTAGESNVESSQFVRDTSYSYPHQTTNFTSNALFPGKLSLAIVCRVKYLCTLKMCVFTCSHSIAVSSAAGLRTKRLLLRQQDLLRRAQQPETALGMEQGGGEFAWLVCLLVCFICIAQIRIVCSHDCHQLQDGNIAERDWQGVQSLPREVALDTVQKVLRVRPAPQLKGLRTGVVYEDKLESVNGASGALQLASGANGLQLEIQVRRLACESYYCTYWCDSIATFFLGFFHRHCRLLPG